MIYVSNTMPRYLQYRPLSSKLKWFPDLGFCVESLKVERLTVLFAVLSLSLACHKVPYINGLLPPVDNIELWAFGSEHANCTGLHDTKGWNPFLLFSCCSNGNPTFSLLACQETWRKSCILMRTPGGISILKISTQRLCPFSRTLQDKLVICLNSLCLTGLFDTPGDILTV